MNNWRERARVVGAGLIVAGVVTPILATTSGADAAIGPVKTTTTAVGYGCTPKGFAVFGPTPGNQTVTVTLSAPAEVTVGQVFDVTVGVSPLTLAVPAVPLTAAPIKIGLAPVGATTTTFGLAVGGNVTASGAVYTVPIATLTATPTVAAGGSVSFTAGVLSVIQGSTGYDCLPLAGAVPATISTSVVGALTTTTVATTTVPTTTTATSTVPGATTTTLVGQTTTTSTTTTTVPATTTTSTTTTTVAPTTTTTAVPETIVTTTVAPPTVPPTPGVVAQIINPSASAPVACNIYDDTGTKFNQNALPESTVTIVFTVPDKVGVGGVISGLVKMDPGPKNGPIALKAGTASYSISISATGATPTTLKLTGGPNGSQIEKDSATASPNMPFSLTTTAPAGASVVIGVTQVEVIATAPAKLTTRCVPSGSAMSAIAKVAVSAQAVVSPAQLTRTVTAAVGAKSVKQTTVSDGYANCAAAKADGRGTILKSDPAYRARLDGDNDGLACETGDPKVLGVSLARTGGDTNTMLLMSVAMCGSGVALVALSRARRRR